MSDLPPSRDRLVVVVDPTAPAPVVTVKVHGEIDLATAPMLDQRLGAVVNSGVRDLVVDLKDVPFCDVAGVNALLQIRGQLGAHGGRLRLIGPCHTLQIIVRVLELEHHLVVASPELADRVPGELDESGDQKS